VEARTRVANGPMAPAEARRFVRSFTDQLPSSVIDDAALVASELVSNSHKYAGNPEGFPIEISVSVGEDRARLEVVNHSIFDPTPETNEELREVRWGLFLIDRIAADWGRISKGGIWAEFELPPDVPVG
jgi:anti-sigma regulatory factor (Ser/Thr protein kinase)